MDESMTAVRISRVLIQQKHCCGGCGEEFNPTEAVFLLQVVRPYRYFDQITNGYQIQFEKQVNDDGDFIHAPYFLHVSCWSEAEESLKELVDGDTTYNSKNSVACYCNFCHAPIYDGELLGIVHQGSFLLSSRQPSMSDALEHTMEGTPTYLCSQCLCELNLNVIENLWEEIGDAFEEDETDEACEGI